MATVIGIDRPRLRNFARRVFELLTTMVVEGEENIPPEGGCILATNHLSRLDTPFIFIIINRDNLSALVTDKYRFNPLFALFVKVTDSVWINREIADFSAMRAGLQIVKQGGMIGIAPEGTRSKSGKLIEAKNGVALLADKARVPILPVGLYGTETAMQEIRALKKPTLHARFGKPFTLPPIERGNHGDSLNRHTEEIMCRIAALLPDKYHGFYAGNPRIRELQENQG